MVEHARGHIRNWETILAEHHWKQVEIDMNCKDLEHCGCAEATAYRKQFDIAAADTHSPWLPPQPVADNEASETRGVVEDTLIERGKNYGDFTDNADYAQRIKQAIYGSKNWHTMPTYMQEALDLIASKIGRMLSGDPFYLDNWHDIGGYTTLVEQRIKQRSTR